ncbi:hypothetical protein B7486_15975 [cyanobacterium TDX16]|nr:hypothetical protein B7486_15975 [cyanobacterium TDX16]
MAAIILSSDLRFRAISGDKSKVTYGDTAVFFRLQLLWRACVAMVRGLGGFWGGNVEKSKSRNVEIRETRGLRPGAMRG